VIDTNENERLVRSNAVNAQNVADAVAAWLDGATLDARVNLVRILLPSILQNERDKQEREFAEASR
jgi:hypothetical protein